jgi:septal ring factor EnvC (AmiA/AmiB activator)
MIRQVGVALSLVLSFFIATGSWTARAWAAKEKNDPISQKIERERQALERLKEEIESKKKHADEAEKKRESVLQAIQDLDSELIARRRERHDVNRKLKDKDREMEGINGELESLRKRMAERRTSVLARLRSQYMDGRFGYLKNLLSAESYGDLQRRFQYLSAVSKREYDLIEAYQGDVGRLEQADQERARARDDMLTFKQETERKLGEIHGLKRQKNVLLARITQEKEAYDRMLGELERSAARIDSLLKELEHRKRAAQAQPNGPRARHETMGPPPGRGGLPWPTDGEVVSFFGRQKHPTFATYIQRKGIEIRTDEGSAIRAVMPGTVAYADWLKGYGLVLILDHQNGFFSLYAHASKLLAKVGEQVQTGQIIGETGDTGMAGENMLYFELREGAEPVDPLPWLAKRR